MAIKIYADAGSNLFKGILEKRNADIKIINMSLTIDDRIYNCYEDEIDVDKFSHGFYRQQALHPPKPLAQPLLEPSPCI